MSENLCNTKCLLDAGSYTRFYKQTDLLKVFVGNLWGICKEGYRSTKVPNHGHCSTLFSFSMNRVRKLVRLSVNRSFCRRFLKPRNFRLVATRFQAYICYTNSTIIGHLVGTLHSHVLLVSIKRQNIDLSVDTLSLIIFPDATGLTQLRNLILLSEI